MYILYEYPLTVIDTKSPSFKLGKAPSGPKTKPGIIKSNDKLY
jgi:hypothetical protein